MSIHHQAKWKEDCQGKYDFDGSLVRFDCRMYSSTRGGKPSCFVTIALGGLGDSALFSVDVQAESDAKLIEAVEQIVDEKAAEVRAAMVRIFGRPTGWPQDLKKVDADDVLWNDWDGVDLGTPVPLASQVEVKLRNGRTLRGVCDGFRWYHEVNAAGRIHDIVAWRLLP